MSDPHASHIAFKNAFIRHFRNERDRSERCIGDIIDLLGDKDSSDTQMLEGIIDRIIRHYDRK